MAGNRVRTAPVLNVFIVAGVYSVPDQIVDEPKTVESNVSSELFQTT